MILLSRNRTLFVLIFVVSMCSFAQKKGFSYSFYGFVRNDLFINSRQNFEGVDGNFYFFPLNKQLDAKGNDLNAVANTGYYAMTTRLGLNMTGPDVWGAQTEARVEADFGGFGSSATMLRLRQAFAKMNWQNGHSLLMGQTWHPYSTESTPRMLNLATGMPFQPFNRTPQLRWWYTQKRWEVSAAAMYQFQYQSSGPTLSGTTKSNSFARNAVIPEVVATLSYKNKHFTFAAAANLLTLRPRTAAELPNNEGVLKVNELALTSSILLTGEYRKELLYIGAKSIYGQNLSHLLLNGGYGVVAEDPITKVRSYEGLNYSTSWLNVSYGKKYQIGTFIGYSKNLGTYRPLLNTNWVYGQGVNMANGTDKESIDQLVSSYTQFSYNLTHWSFGLEYSTATAYYGRLLTNGRVNPGAPVTNHRALLLMVYHF